MNDAVELMSLFWTTAGVYPGVGEVSRFDFEERVQAAAKAGFRGIGIWHTDLDHVTRTTSLTEIASILDDNGITCFELEFLTDWFVEGSRKASSDRRRSKLLEASQAFGADHIKVGDFDRTPCTMSRVIDAFGELCQEAAKYRARIGFEFMPSSMINSLRDALTMVVSAGADNGGLVLDVAHVVSLGIGFDELRSIPPRYLVSVELNDGTLPASAHHDASGARRYCGEGEYDVGGFIDSVRKAGYVGPWAVEVFSPELTAKSLEELSDRAYRTTIAQFRA